MIRYYQVDAFTDVPFAGNPAAVVPLESDAPAAWMQSLAAELNLSETAFLLPLGTGSWSLRWFTPAIEVPLCGHATLASAHVLFDTGLAGDAAAVRFQTCSGELTVQRAAGGGYTMDFPCLEPEPWQPPASALAALGLEDPVAAGASFHHPEDWYVVIELADADAVRAVEPDMRALAREKGGGWIVTAAADEKAAAGADFVSRFFAPDMGVDEDPVTGSAHCCLAPWWSRKLGRSEVVGHQISRRGGVVHCRVDGDRVLLGGRAATVSRGEILVLPDGSGWCSTSRLP